MKRKLFCEISPLTYKISTCKCIAARNIKDFIGGGNFAKVKSKDLLPVIIYKHKSLIYRKLGNSDLKLQDNKYINLTLSAPLVSNVLIMPGEIFSFWHLVGNPTEKKGYRAGLTIRHDGIGSGIGGGMCQFTNLIHWMILHTDLDIIEHHHHDRMDLFPDFKRQIPFGTGTSIMYNYLDYRFKNNTSNTYQLVTYTTKDYLCGEIRSNERMKSKYHVKSENEAFVEEDGIVYRIGNVYRIETDVKTGNEISKELIRENHAKVMYDTSNLKISEIAK